MLRLTGLLGVLLIGATTLAVATPAQAEVDLINCTGSQLAHYAPPLGPLPRQTTVQVIERLGEDGGGTCTGPVTGGIAAAVFHQQASCLIPPPSGTLPEPNVITYHWHGGAQSTITFTVTTVTRGVGQTIVTSLGTVTDGYRQGAPALRVKALLDLNLSECLASQVEENGGPMTLTIG